MKGRWIVSDFCTEHLTGDQLAIANAVLAVLPKGSTGGGCRAFWTPAEWKERGENYGNNATLILVHDGGALAAFCNYDYCEYAKIEKLDKALGKIGYYVEACTSWYSGVYAKDGA